MDDRDIKTYDEVMVGVSLINASYWAERFPEMQKEAAVNELVKEKSELAVKAAIGKIMIQLMSYKITESTKCHDWGVDAGISDTVNEYRRIAKEQFGVSLNAGEMEKLMDDLL